MNQQTGGHWPWETTRETAMQQLRERPEDLEGIIRTAESLWQTGRRGHSLDFLETALKRHPGEPRLLELFQRRSKELAARTQR